MVPINIAELYADNSTTTLKYHIILRDIIVVNIDISPLKIESQFGDNKYKFKAINIAKKYGLTPKRKMKTRNTRTLGRPSL